MSPSRNSKGAHRFVETVSPFRLHLATSTIRLPGGISGLLRAAPTGLANTVYQDLDHIGEISVNEMIALNAHGMLGVPTIHWTHILPGAGIRLILQHALHAQHTQRWYSVIGWRDSKYWFRYGVATKYMLAWMKAWGVSVEGPHIVNSDQPSVIARALRDTFDSHGRVLLCSGVSQAVRVCLAAQQQDLDLTGTAVRVNSEPLTPAKAARIEDAGMRIITGYSSVETGRMGDGCPNRAQVDDVHIWKNAFALFTHPYTLPDRDLTVPAFNLTSLRQNAPKVMLNYQSDDYGVVETRKCGCVLDRFGYTTHAHTIRSYSKLVGEGVTLIGNEMGSDSRGGITGAIRRHTARLPDDGGRRRTGSDPPCASNQPAGRHPR